MSDPQNETLSPAQEQASKETAQLPNPFARIILSMGALLAAFAFVTILLCILTAWLTAPRIADNQRQALERTLTDVFPPSEFDNDLLNATVTLPGAPLGYNKTVTAYRAKKGNEATGVIFPIAAHEGYGGTINLLIGTDAKGTLTGVRVLPPHPETPGLGDQIEVSKSDWILGFTGRSLQNTPPKQWAVKKDGGVFDSFTGATITPRAVVKGVHQALRFFEDEQQTLLGEQISSVAPEKPAHQNAAHTQTRPNKTQE